MQLIDNNLLDIYSWKLIYNIDLSRNQEKQNGTYFHDVSMTYHNTILQHLNSIIDFRESKAIWNWDVTTATKFEEGLLPILMYMFSLYFSLVYVAVYILPFLIYYFSVVDFVSGLIIFSALFLLGYLTFFSRLLAELMDISLIQNLVQNRLPGPSLKIGTQDTQWRCHLETKYCILHCM